MKILITGSRGYIGTRLCQILNEQYNKKFEIIGLDNNFYEFKKIEKN